MTISEAHEKATSGDRIFRVRGYCNGFWYQDHILEFVTKHKENCCKVVNDTNQLIAVEMEE